MMISLTAGVALVVAVLAPMQASAECAWVLWSNHVRIDRGYRSTGPLRKEDLKEPVILEDKWVMVVVVDSLAACNAALERAASHHRNSGWQRSFANIDSSPLFKEVGLTVDESRQWRCLPDTIDPPGPTTK